MFEKKGSSILNYKSKKFAIRIVKYIKEFGVERNLQSIYNQLLKSATSVHANVLESEFAQSPADFASKLSISLKETNETMGWLELLYGADCMSKQWYDSLSSDCKEIIAMLVSSIRTIKRNNNIQ